MTERKWIVRQGSMIDIARTCQLLHKCFQEGKEYYPMNFSAVYEAYASPSLLRGFMECGGHLLVAESSGIFCGCAFGVPDDSRAAFGTYYCACIAVDLPHRHQGIGWELLQDIKRQAANAKCHKIYCLINTNNTPALSMLHKSGFKEEGILKRHWAELDFYFISHQLSSNA